MSGQWAPKGRPKGPAARGPPRCRATRAAQAPPLLFGLLRQWAESRDHILRDMSLRPLRRDLFKSTTVADSHNAIPAFINAHEEVKKAFERHRLSMDYYFIGDEHVAAGYRPYSAADSDKKGAAINYIMVAGKSGRLEEISRWSDLVGATTMLVGKPRVFCPSVVAG